MGVNTEIGLQETGEGMGWIQLAQHRGKCRLVETRLSTFGFYNMRGISRLPEEVLRFARTVALMVSITRAMLVLPV